jgi:sugar O-acyltransferase (sialic acid O-acetyltransferase NeuD family)
MRALVYGSRPDGHAKVVVELAAADPALEIVGLVDDYTENAERTIRDLLVLGAGADLARVRSDHAAAILLGFGDSVGRAEIGEKALSAGFELPELIHESARVCTSARLAAGVQVLALSYIGPDARLGSCVLVNTAAVVEHDAVVEDGAVIGPHATVCGRALVGREATIGAGATILPDVRIGARAVVGAGALVREAVADATTVAGVPAKVLQ